MREKSGLVRLAASGGVLEADLKGIMPGRGVYICQSEACLKEAYKKKDPFSRALKSKVVLPSLEELWVKIKGRI